MQRRTFGSAFVLYGASLRPDLALIRDRRCLGLGRSLIAEVVTVQRLQIFVEGIDQRDSGGNIHLDDLVVWDVIEILHQCPKAVAVGDDQDPLAGSDFGGNHLVPVPAGTWQRCP